MSTFFYLYAFSVLYLTYIGITMYRGWAKEHPGEKMKQTAGLWIILIFIPCINAIIAILLIATQIANLVGKLLVKIGVMEPPKE